MCMSTIDLIKTFLKLTEREKRIILSMMNEYIKINNKK